MAIISFAMTTGAFLDYRKTVTRRFWNRAYAERWQKWYDEGKVFHQAYDKLPRNGGQQIGSLRLTCRPYWEQLGDMPESDLEAEGGYWASIEEFIEALGKTPEDEAFVIRFEKVD